MRTKHNSFFCSHIFFQWSGLVRPSSQRRLIPCLFSFFLSSSSLERALFQKDNELHYSPISKQTSGKARDEKKGQTTNEPRWFGPKSYIFSLNLILRKAVRVSVVLCLTFVIVAQEKKRKKMIRSLFFLTGFVYTCTFERQTTNGSR